MTARYYRKRIGGHKASVSMSEDCFQAIKDFIRRNPDFHFTTSGAIHHLLRTHPEINLSPIK